MIKKVDRLPLPDRFTKDSDVAAATLGYLHQKGFIDIWHLDSMNIADALESLSGFKKDVFYQIDSDFAFLTGLTLSQLASKIDAIVEKAENDKKFLEELIDEAESELGMELYLAFMNP